MKRNVHFFALIVITSLWSCNGGGSFGINEKPKSPEELRRELKIQEQAAPTRYLTISESTMKQNKIEDAGFFHGAKYDGYLVEGTILNTASIARFKDIFLSIKLFSKTQTVIEEKDYVIYEYYEPRGSKRFSIKVNPPEATEKFNVSVKSATPTE